MCVPCSCVECIAGVCTYSCVQCKHMFMFLYVHVHICLVRVYMFTSMHMSGGKRLISGVIVVRVTIAVMKHHGQCNLGEKDLHFTSLKEVRTGIQTKQDLESRSWLV